MLQTREWVEHFQELPSTKQVEVLALLQQTYQQQAQPQRIADLAMRYSGEWLAVSIPADEDRYTPKRGFLLAHHMDRVVVWQQIEHVAQQQDVFVFYAGPIMAKGFGITFHDTTDTPEAATLVE